MTDFATVTFSFTKTLRSRKRGMDLNENCRERSPTEPLCAFTNLSAHFLSCALIFLTFKDFLADLRLFQNKIEALACRLRDGGKMDNKDRPKSLTAKHLMLLCTKVSDHLGTQQLLRTNQELFSDIKVAKLCKQTEMIRKACEPIALGGEPGAPSENFNLAEIMQECHRNLSVFLHKLDGIADKINALDKHILSIHCDLLGERAVGSVTKRTFEKWVNGRMSLIAEVSGIWGESCLKTLTLR